MPHGTAIEPSSPPQAGLNAACLLAATLPALLAYNVPPSATFYNQAAALVGWGLVAGGVAVAGPARLVWGRGLPALIAALGLLLLAALVAPLAAGLPWGLALSSAGMLAAAAVLALAGAQAAPRGGLASAWQGFALAWVVAGVLSSAIGLVQVFAPEVADGNWIARSTLPGRAVGNLRQPNHLSSLLLWSAIAVVALGEARVLARAATAVLLGLLVLGVTLSASRTGMVGVALLALWGLGDRRLSGATRALLLAAPLLYALSWAGLAAWAHASDQVFAGEARLAGGDVSSSRFGIWANTLALIARHPWAGVGWGEFNFAWTLTAFPGRPTAFFDHTHNLPLQLAVELGLPLAALVLALLGVALWRALRTRNDEAGTAETIARRAAAMMVLMIGVHSLLEYPLWYAHFLLPAAYAFGLALGAVPPDPPRPSAVGATRPLLLAAMLVMAGGFAAVYDYQRVVAIFTPPPGAGPLGERIEAGRRSWFFAHHADYGATMVARHPSQEMPSFRRPVHFLLDSRLMMAWSRALDESGQTDKARHLAQRLREFRRELDDEAVQQFFAPCDAGHPPGASAPFQCAAPARPLDWREFR